MSAPPDQEFIDLADRANVAFAPAFYAIRKWIEDKAKPSAPNDFQKLAAEVMTGQYDAISAATEGCDIILGTGLFPSAAAAQTVAEKRGIRFMHVAYCPLYLPSHHHRPMLWPTHPFPPEMTDIRDLWAHNAQTMNLLFGGALNALRASINLPPVSNARDHAHGDLQLLASDPVLWPWQPTDLSHATQTGAWVLPDTRALSPDLLAFLDAGAPPVYAGFGSMATPATTGAAQATIAAIRAQGRRIIIARGWANLALIDDGADCFITGDVNQQALFPRLAAVIHHGGAGTTATAARSATPQIIVPQVADQPYWGERIAALGIGAHHPGATPAFDSLSAALQIALAPETRARAAAIARAMNADGAMIAARLLLDLPAG